MRPNASHPLGPLCPLPLLFSLSQWHMGPSCQLCSLNCITTMWARSSRMFPFIESIASVSRWSPCRSRNRICYVSLATYKTHACPAWITSPSNHDTGCTPGLSHRHERTIPAKREELGARRHCASVHTTRETRGVKERRL